MFDLYKSKKGTYCATLLPGDYIINATMTGFKEFSEYFQAVKGECPAEFTLAKKTVPKMSVSAIDIVSGAPVVGTLLKVRLFKRIIVVVDCNWIHECRRLD